jgi:hypothetical protein
MRNNSSQLGACCLSARLSRGSDQPSDTADGEPLFLIEASDGGYILTPYDPDFQKKMAKADDIINRYRDTLHVLAK